MSMLMLNEEDFRIVGGDEKKFIALPLSKWNDIMMLLSNEDLVDKFLKLDVQGVRIELES